MIRSRDYIRALVSGIAGEDNRKKRLVLMLQAYFDESETGGKVFVLGGYVSTIEKWEKFSDEWDALLKKHNIPEFKMKENSGNYERALDFYRVIQKNVLFSIGIPIDREFLDIFIPILGVKNYKNNKLKTGLNNPYIWAFRTLMSDGINSIKKLGYEPPMDIIFDERSDCHHALDGFDFLKATSHPSISAYFTSKPSFKPSIEYKPLQAADMYSWCVRKGELSGGWEYHPYFKGEKSIPEIFIPKGPLELLGDISFVFSPENDDNYEKFIRR